MSANFIIRPATDCDEDINDILALVKELAEYEKAVDQAKATVELIRQNLFKTPFAHALLAFQVSSDGSPTGPAVALALYFFNFSTWTGRPGLYLEDLFVRPEFRGKGIAKAFFAELAKVAQEKNCARMDWAVLKWNTPSIDFYEKGLGASALSEWFGMRLEEEGIENLKIFSF